MAGTSERIGAVVSMRSGEGLSVFNPNGPIDAARSGVFTSTLEDARYVADALVQQGFQITNFHPIAISFSGTAAQFRDIFGVRLQQSTRPGGRGRSIEVHTPDADDAPRLLDLPKAFGSRADGVAIACPPRLIDDAGLPVRGLNGDQGQDRCLPDELAMSIWGDGLASLDATGDGVVAALIGTGHYRHRFFAERRYRVLPTLLGPGQTRSLQDDHGHGTGEAACLFAAAPNLRLRPVKGLLDPVGDMLMTIDSLPRPDLIINSWGYDVDQISWDELRADDLNLHNYLRLLEMTMAHATAQSIVVVATAPRTWQSFPASHPDVIAIGAATSGRSPAFGDQREVVSHLNPGRQVPDFWSRAGDADGIGYPLNDRGFVQPTQPGSILSTMGTADVIASEEGWACCDLDQASFPLAASMIAVLLERHRKLPPQALKALMAKATESLVPFDLTGKAGTDGSRLSLGGGIDGKAVVSAVNDHVATSFEPAPVKAGAMT